MPRTRKRRKKRRTSLYLVMMIVAVFLGTLAIQGMSLRKSYRSLVSQQSELDEKKQELEKEKQEIEEKKEYLQSDEYIEDVAREKFGLVYEDEIIFKADSE